MTEKQRKRSRKRKNSGKKKAKAPPMTNGLSKDYISDRSNENLLQPGSPDKIPETLNVEYKPKTGEIEMVDIVEEVNLCIAKY